MIIHSCLAALFTLCSATPSQAEAAEPVANFSLRDYRGTWRALDDWDNAELVVVVFLGTECPLAKLYAPRLARLEEQYRDRGVVFIGIDSNRQDSMTELLHYARRYGVTFPILKDAGNEVADQFGAERTPEMFVLDRQRVVRYRGRIDDQYGVGVQRDAPRRRDLERALDELLSGSVVSVPRTEAPGCIIGRIRAPEPDGQVTWSRQIAPIFQQHCQECHRPGQIAPFSLLTYEDVVGWAEMIREVVEQQRMPPWHANPHYGDFANAALLSEEEKALIYRWVADGAPEGDPSDLPPPAEFTEGWQIPEPDQVIYMADEPFTVPAEGIVEYQWFTVDPGWTEDKWITMVECRPGNTAVVHHVTVYFKPPWVDWDLPLGDRINLLGGFAPGKRPVNLDHWDGTARLVPAGSHLVFEMHYTPTGTLETDRSSIAVVFAEPDEVRRQLSMVMIANRDFTIPPGAADHVVESSYTFDEDSLVYSFSPHMHLRGKSFRFVASFPDGEERILLDVPAFDFNWQFDYLLAEPLRAPEGTRMQCIATFDNSSDNPANPDPQATVRWGDQTWEEMMIGTIAIAPVDQDLQAGSGKPAGVDGTYRTLTAAAVVAAIPLLFAAGLVVRRHRRAASAALVLLTLSVAAPAQSAAGDVDAASEPAPAAAATDSRVGQQVKPFALEDQFGREWTLDELFENQRLLVVAFFGTECPLARLYSPRLVALADDYADRKVAVVAIDPNRQDSLEEIAAHAQRFDFEFPFLRDVGNVLADEFGALRTPEVFVLDAQRVVRYVGRIDDQYGVDFARPAPQRRDLVEALEELLADMPVSVPATEAPGCLIGRMRTPDEDADVTWSEHVAAIFQRRCQECHRPGEIAPFALEDYDEVVGWAAMIEEVIVEGRMPPWHADAPRGRFAQDARLTGDEREAILAWVAAGAPQGDPALLPPPREFPEGWRLPREPDLIVPMRAEPVDVAAEGVIEYQYFVADPGFTEGRYVDAAECRPGNRAVVHHINVFVLPPELDRPGLTRDDLAEMWELQHHMLCGYVPGMRPTFFPAGMAKYVPAGAKFVFQMHYTPNGEAQSDLSLLGLVLAPLGAQRRPVNTVPAMNNWFVIPPYEADHTVHLEHRIKQDALVLSFLPHMHLRGKAFRFIAHYPDETKELLLDVPRYDFNWQNRYVLAEPQRLPAGTVVECVAVFDNSPDNLANPDPSAEVRWGEQSWEEMMIGYFDIVTLDTPKTTARSSRPRLAIWFAAGIATLGLVGLWRWRVAAS